MMKLKNKRTILMAVFALLFMGAAAFGALSFRGNVAFAQTADEDDELIDADDGAEGPDVPITGAALEQASAAALEYLGEGRVTETEVGDEEGYYEVEVTLDDGRQVDVHLDEAFNILSTEED
jgi:uncharacterized membrane protein YkoI